MNEELEAWKRIAHGAGEELCIYAFFLGMAQEESARAQAAALELNRWLNISAYREEAALQERDAALAQLDAQCAGEVRKWQGAILEERKKYERAIAGHDRAVRLIDELDGKVRDVMALQKAMPNRIYTVKPEDVLRQLRWIKDAVLGLDD
jgi:hypothetical protein